MKFLIVLPLIMGVVCSAPSVLFHSHPLVYSVVPASSQYHAQSGLGDYAYGYSGGPSAKSEVKTLDGITQGSYSYVDAENKLQTVNYVADAVNGFRVAATNLPTAPIDTGKAPEPVQDTPEVASAKLEHAALVAKAQSGSEAPAQESEPLKAPEPVEDTVEVKAARAEHLQAVENAKVRNALAVDDSTVIAPQTIAVHSPFIVHPHAVHLAHAPTVQVRTLAPFSYSVVNAGIPHLISA